MAGPGTEMEGCWARGSDCRFTEGMGRQVPGCSVWWRWCSVEADWSSDVCGLETAGPVGQLLRTQRCSLQLGQRSIRMDTAHSRQNEAKQGVAELGCTLLNETLLKQNMRF